MKILVLNCGSSSLKYRVIQMPEEVEILKGEAERVGIISSEIASITHKVKGIKRVIKQELPNHGIAFNAILKLIEEDTRNDNSIGFDIFAHRYVNAGISFNNTSRIVNSDLPLLRETFEIAPLHNPICYQLIEICDQEFPEIPQFIVTDNSFHSTIPDALATYALPMELSRKYSLRRMGYHGISHKYVAIEACKYLNKDIKTQKIISCHLGTGGSSICAIKFGKSINSSMGFTPLEGLIMNTRSGNVDMAVVFHMMYNDSLSVKETETLMNKKSGVLGIYGESSDLRDAIKNIKNSRNARLAVDMYVNRIKKYIGNYVLLLKKIDLLIFTDSLGVDVPLIRNTTCDGLTSFGIEINKNLSNDYSSGISVISEHNSEVKILVVPTNEELMIAREAFQTITSNVVI
jgi:acetate kinase